MKKLWENDEVEELLRKYNPLGFRFSNGRPYEFTTKAEVYLFFLIRVYGLFPRGYIETALLVAELYFHISFTEAKAYAKWMKPMGVAPCVFVDYHSKEACMYLENVIRALHKICESEFDSNSYKEAWNLFQHRLELEDLKKQKKEEQNNDNNHERGKE